jgi:hypothetical protein
MSKLETEKSRMTLFKDDRQEDWAAILISVIVVVIIMIMTMK